MAAPAPAWMVPVVGALVYVPVILLLLVNGFFRVLFTCNPPAGGVAGAAVLHLVGAGVPPLPLLPGAEGRPPRVLLRVRPAGAPGPSMRRTRTAATRYPIVLVHGIFFRDWQHVNYWGRIPQAPGGLRGGAVLRRPAVGRPGGGLRPGAGRAHPGHPGGDRGGEGQPHRPLPKGAWTSRYAITCLGLGPPRGLPDHGEHPPPGVRVCPAPAGHPSPVGSSGCWSGSTTPSSTPLGDQTPDFMGGVRDLACDACAAFNQAGARRGGGVLPEPHGHHDHRQERRLPPEPHLAPGEEVRPGGQRRPGGPLLGPVGDLPGQPHRPPASGGSPTGTSSTCSGRTSTASPSGSTTSAWCRI